MDFHRHGRPRLRTGLRLRPRRRPVRNGEPRSMSGKPKGSGQTGRSDGLPDRAIAIRADVLFAEQNDANLRRTDRWFASLLALEWLVGIVFAMTISPRIWSGRFSETHIHV